MSSVVVNIFSPYITLDNDDENIFIVWFKRHSVV